MKIGGLHKTSLIDFPGKVSCVVFLSGCNFDCPYCHNPELVRGGSLGQELDMGQLFSFLEKRRKHLEGVVITGGEPTIHPDLADFCRRIKSLGFAIKLDTNGSRPAVINLLVSEGLLDFLAMDLKTAPELYPRYISGTSRPSDIEESVKSILNSGLPHEFRTTCVRPIIDDSSIETIARLIEGAERHSLQKVQHKGVNVLHPEFFQENDWFVDDSALDRYRKRILKFVSCCTVR